MQLTIPPVNVITLVPQIVVAVTAMLVLLVDLWTPADRKRYLAQVSLAGLVVAFVVTLALWGRNETGFAGMIRLDHYALFLNLIFLAASALTILVSVSYLAQQGLEHGEYYALVLFATGGMMVMGASADLIALFLGLETFSIALYVLAGFARTRLDSEESALKYFLLGAFASSFLLYGIALTYGATGFTNLSKIAAFLSQQKAVTDSPMLLLGVGLIIVGFGFKIAMAPFHMWTPDVYEGAPTSVTAFMAAATKVAGFAALLRILLIAFPAMYNDWMPILAFLAAVTMTIGNVVAIAQSNIKRMLAYSSIAHAGYVLVAVVSGSAAGTSAALFYLVAYALMTLGAFAVVISLGQRELEIVDIQEYAGLATRQPLLALLMAIFMLSLAGFPPMAGFIGKFYIFSAAVQSGLVWLALIGVLNSVLSVYYYLRIVVLMYMREPTRELGKFAVSPLLMTALLVAAIGTVFFGIFPGGLIGLAKASILAAL